MAWATWRDAMQRALYGPDGFFQRERPVDHFRTSVHASRLFAGAISQLAELTGAKIVVDVGAGRGELLAEIGRDRPDLTLVGVEMAARPFGLPSEVGWCHTVPTGLSDVLLIANEWLDNVPVDIVEVDRNGTPRLVEVDLGSGAERLGEPVSGTAEAWLRRWWPIHGAEPGDRAEIGLSRDSAWAGVVRGIHRGVAVTVDYGHLRDARPRFGSLAGYRDGRMVMPVPDSSCDLTVHVALDACAAAGTVAGATASVLTTQRRVLRALGIDAALPAQELAHTDPPAYLTALGRASEAAELLDSSGLGGFGWLIQAVRAPIPASLAASPRS